MKQLRFLILSTFLFSCSEKDSTLQTGMWRGVFFTQDEEIPFNFEISRNDSGFYVQMVNAAEKLDAGQVTFEGDSIIIPMGYFDASIKAKLSIEGLEGYFTKHFANNYFIPFKAEPENYRFAAGNTQTNVNFEGKWEVSFYDPDDDRYTPGVGIFNQDGSLLTGTFLTPTGDYRFLQGNVINSALNLSTFDGEHLYLFKASLKDSLLEGEYFSGLGGYKTWTAKRNPDAVMPGAEEITYLREGYETITFSFPDMDGNMVSLADEKYQNKVVVVQIFGTWCPNCMDETKFMADWYEDNKDRGVEIIGLAYENKDDFAYARARINKMVEKLNVSYDFLFAGSRDNAKASATLPMLNKITAFPTTIFIDKSGKVRKIHAGFSGPGTGHYYIELVEEFNTTIDELVSEEKQ